MADARKMILIVEDEAPLSLALGNTLEQEDFEVLTAADGEVGLKLALEKRPDMILADLKLPKMNGIDMIKAIRADEWGKSAHIIVLTNISNATTLDDVMSVGAFHYFVKSDTSMSDIVAAIRSRLQSNLP